MPVSRSARGRTVGLLRDWIERGGVGEGDRLPPETVLAQQFDVSRMTLRSALGILEREGVVRRERNVGCVRVKHHDTQTSLMSRTIVLLSDHLVANDAGNFGGTSDAVVSGVIDAVGRREMNFFRVRPSDDNDLWLRELARARPSGVVVSFWNYSNALQQVRIIERLKSNGLPVTAFGHSSLFDGIDTVRTDHQSGTHGLVHVLANAGKRRILRAWTPGPEISWILDHDKGYEKATRELGLEAIPSVHLAGLLPREAEGEANFRIRARHFAGYLVEHLHGPNPVDAIMVATDWEALVALAACRLYGRADIAVVGYDNYWRNIPERQWEAGTPFATVEKNNHRLGEELVSLLMQRIAGELPSEPQTRLIEQRIVITSENGHS
jgi:DNA-binding LacI/PurR family transcriptional regulator